MPKQRFALRGAGFEAQDLELRFEGLGLALGTHAVSPMLSVTLSGNVRFLSRPTGTVLTARRLSGDGPRQNRIEHPP